jgi:hypothetical protein
VNARRISTSIEFDDERYWRFARSSGLPFGYFGTRRKVGAVVVRAALIALATAFVLLLV